MNLEHEIAHDLLSIGAVFLRPDQPFTWASGIKSPIYCDNRLTLTAPAVRTAVEKGLVELIRTHYPDVEVLMGTSTAGIAHAAIVGHLMDLPMGYVRSGNKDHGRQNRIEGRLEKGQKVVVVEDLISTAGSCIEVVEALREAGAEVLGVASIFTYGLQKGLDRLAAANVVNHSLSNFDAVCEVAAEEGKIKPEDIERLKRFRATHPTNPGSRRNKFRLFRFRRMRKLHPLHSFLFFTPNPLRWASAGARLTNSAPLPALPGAIPCRPRSGSLPPHP